MAVENCEFLDDCPFFNDRMRNMPAMTGIFKSRYCRGDKTICARYMVRMSLGKDQVDPDLFPDQFIRAEKLIGSKKSR